MKCDCPGCQHSQIDALQERLGAEYFQIDDIAKGLKQRGFIEDCTVAAAEQWIRGTLREHNLDLVEAGLEQVGPGPHFISRPHPSGLFYVKLYSILPEEQRTSGRLQ